MPSHYNIGIMQGRLSPKVKNMIQSFPTKFWVKEFLLAKRIGLNFVEWIIDFDQYKDNPILSNTGISLIKELIQETEIYIPSICVDYFATYPLIFDEYKIESKELLLNLIDSCNRLNINIIEIPLIGIASAKTKDAQEKYIEFFYSFEPFLKEKNLKFALETDLEPKLQKNFINEININNIGLNYDIGNSAYWGYNLEEEIDYFGKNILNVHLKDCTPKDYSVQFGDGNADFWLLFNLLNKINYQGDFVLQGARGSNDYETVVQQLLFIKSYLK